MRTLQLDLFIPPLHGDKEYYMAKGSIVIMSISKRPSEKKELEELRYRVIRYEIEHGIIY